MYPGTRTTSSEWTLGKAPFPKDGAALGQVTEGWWISFPGGDSAEDCGCLQLPSTQAPPLWPHSWRCQDSTTHMPYTRAPQRWPPSHLICLPASGQGSFRYNPPWKCSWCTAPCLSAGHHRLLGLRDYVLFSPSSTLSLGAWAGTEWQHRVHGAVTGP